MERALSDLLLETERGVDGANALAVETMAAKIAAAFMIQIQKIALIKYDARFCGVG